MTTERNANAHPIFRGLLNAICPISPEERQALDEDRHEQWRQDSIRERIAEERSRPGPDAPTGGFL